jgi:predicted MFS family arabinose efflux permease
MAADADAPPAIRPDTGVDGGTLARLTAAKTVSNVALRWIPPFLPTLERAFGATTTQLTTVLGIGELAGLSTIFVGRQLDRDRERTVMIAALGLVGASAVIALAGTVATFAVSFFILVVGVSNLTVAGQAWISHRVDYRWRARSIGLYETSWAIALLAGAPVAAVLINIFGWRGPFVAIAAACVGAAILVARTLPSHAPAPAVETVQVFESPDGVVPHGVASQRTISPSITARAWLVMIGSASIAMAGLSVFVISGSWLDDAFGVSTGGIGAVAMLFGATELVASLASAAYADRLGKMRTTLAGVSVLLVGLALMVSADGRLALGILGLVVFLLGFETSFVVSLSLVSESMPNARGNALAVSNAVGTVARACGVVASGWLYNVHGIAGTATLSASAAVLAVASLLVSRRLAPIRR